MSSSGKSGNNRKNRRFSGRKEESQKQVKKHSATSGTENPFFEDRFEKERANPHSAKFSALSATKLPAHSAAKLPALSATKFPAQERPQWTAPVLPANPITTPDCPWCGKPIKDIATAICDKDSGRPVHFDCVLSRISETENLDNNDSVCYIGGGRFGIVHYNNPPDTRDFTIKKIFEWENKDSKSEWRKPISEYFSLT